MGGVTVVVQGLHPCGCGYSPGRGGHVGVGGVMLKQTGGASGGGRRKGNVLQVF